MLSGDSLRTLEVCAAGFGVFGGLFIANVYASAYDVTTQRNYGFVAGVMNMIGGFAAGAAVLLTGMLKESFGTALVVRLLAISSAVAAVLLAAVVFTWFARDQKIVVIERPVRESSQR
jgi:MFS family permease